MECSGMIDKADLIWIIVPFVAAMFLLMLAKGQAKG